MNKNQKDFITILRSVFTGEELPSCSDWEEIYTYAKKHNVQNMITGAAQVSSGVPAHILTNLQRKADQAIAMDMTRAYEIEEVQREFEKEKIPVIMLKGWVMKSLYPRTDLRTMADTDIFMKAEDELRVHTMLLSLGFESQIYGGRKDNIYSKEPFVTVEMHKNFFLYEDHWNQLFNNPDSPMYIWNRINREKDFLYIYCMDKELFFVYMIAHMAVHLKNGGTGVRAFLDLWIYQRKNQELDQQIIQRDLDLLGLSKFAENVIKLSQMWFDGKECKEEKINQFGDYILQCGVYGNSDFFVASNEALSVDSRWSRMKYLLNRAFPSADAMKTRFPLLDKKPYLLPYYYVKRLWRDGFQRRSIVKNEIKSIKEIDYQEVRQIHKLYQDIGL